MECELYFKFVIRVAMSFCDWKLFCDIKVFYTMDQIDNCYRQVSNMSQTLVGNKIVDYFDVIGASPVGTAPTTSSFST